MRPARSASLIFAALAFTLTTATFAQSYPNRPIRFILPFAASGGTDVVARLFAERMALDFGHQLPYDPMRDLAPVGMTGSSAYVLAVHPSVPVKSVSDLIALAKAKPGDLRYAAARRWSAS